MKHRYVTLSATLAALALAGCETTPATNAPADVVTATDAVDATDVVTPADVVNATDVVNPTDVATPADVVNATDVVNPTDVVTPADVVNATDVVTPTDAGAPVDAAAPMDAGMLCNNVSLAGAPNVELVRLAESAPTLNGGTLVAGTYRRTGWAALTGTGGATGGTGSRRQTALIVSDVTATSARIQFADRLNDGAVTASNGTATLSGNMATFAITCPTTANLRVTYEVRSNPTQIVFYGSSNMQLETYTLDGMDAGAPVDAGPAPDVQPLDGGCVSITNTAPVLTSRNMIGGTLPTPTGGTIRDGRYHLTDLYYTRSATIRQQQLTLVIAGGEFQIIDTRPGVSENRARGTSVISGNTLQTNTVCPAVSTGSPITFTATDTTITLVHSADQRVEVLTRQ